MTKRILAMLLATTLMFHAVPWTAVATQLGETGQQETSQNSQPAVDDQQAIVPGDQLVGDIQQENRSSAAAKRDQRSGETAPTLQQGTTGSCIWTLNGTVLTVSGNGEMEDYSQYDALPWGADVETVIIQQGVTRIGEYAFYNCKQLKEVAIAASVRHIGANAFYSCSALQRVTFEEGSVCECIDESAFEWCEALAEFAIPESVVRVGSRAFIACDKLPRNYYDSAKYIGSKDNPYFLLEEADEDYTDTIHRDTKIIGSDAFRYSQVRSITVPEGVTGIMNGAFSQCFYLTSITLASSVTYVDAGAFNSSNALQYTYYENGKYLGDKNNPYHILVAGTSSGIIHSNTKVIAGGAFQKVSVTEVTLPDGVVSIGASAFAQCGYLTEITIPDSVRFIGKEAFFSCSKLTDVYIDDLAAWCQIDFADYYAQPMAMAQNLYLNGKQLEELVIPNGITNVKGYAFYGCEQLKSVIVSAAVASIDSYAFANCTALSELTFAAGSQCKAVGNSAFSNTILETVSLPDGITSIGRYAFGDCIWLSDLTIPSSVRSIGERAFVLNGYTRAMKVRITDIDAWCAIVFGDYLANPLSGSTLYVGGSLLTKLTVSDSITCFNDYVFYGYTRLTEVSVGKNVKEIGAHAFGECTSLKRVVFDGQTNCSEIGDYAFQGCTSLTEITLPGGVRRIGISAFEECTALTKVAFAEDSVCTTIDWGAFRNCENLSEFAMPESVLHIGDYAFYGCGMLTDIAIPKNAVSIGLRAFYQCSALQTVTIPKGVTAIEQETFYDSGLEEIIFEAGSLCETIGEKAFYECRGLTQTILPNGLTTIGADAFHWCTKLKQVTIPDSVTAIASQAFMNCTQLTTVNISDLAAWCAIDFGDYYANPIYYAKGLYQNGQKITKLEIPVGTTAIGAYAFHNGSSFTALTIPDSVKQIGVRAFSGCTGLTEVVVPNSVQGIGASAFADCTKLHSITLPFVGTASGVGKLEDIFRSSNAGISGASQVPSSLKSVTVTGGNIPASAFRYCRNLTKITLPETAQEIGSYAFQSCSGLTELKIPNSVTKIGSYAFQSCSGLISLEIPESVTSIGSYALSGCSNLQELTVPFVGDTPKTATDTYQYPFGYIFGTSSYTGGAATKQTYYGRSTTTTTTTTYCIPTALKTVTVNGGNLLYGAFGNCTSITKIIIGSNVKYIDPNAFTGTTALEEFSVSKRNPNYCSSSRILYNKDQSELIWCPDKHTFIFQVTYTYANGQTAFDTIYKRLKAGAAYNAEIPEILGYHARIETISGAMPAEDLLIDVIYYENDVLRKGSCTNTLSWTLYDDGALIFRGTGEMPDYTAGNAPWAEHADKVLSVYIDPRVTAIGAYAFENCRNLTFVDYGYSVASIGEYAFAGCSGLTAFKLPESVTTISAGAFSRCTGLKNVVIPDNITAVADDAFLGCDQLVQVTVGGAVAQIGSNAFAQCPALTQVYFRGKPTMLGSNALGSTGGKFVYYYSSVALWDEAIEDGKWNGYTAVPYNAIARENFTGTNVYIIKVVDRYNTPLVNAVVDLGGEIRSTNADGMVYYLKPTQPQALSVSCSNHITFQDAAFVATDKQIMDIIELSDRPSTVQGVSFNGKSIATSVGVLNCADTSTVKIAVSGYSKYTITKYELHQGDRLLATEKTDANSCAFTVKASAFEEGQTVLVRMYTADGNMVASALNVDVIKLASVSEKQIMGELSNIDLNVGVGELGDLNFKLPFDGKGDEKLYTMVQGRTIRIGVNLDIKELFEKKETPLSVIQKKVDKAVENFSVVDADVSFKICGYIEIEYLGGGEYYLKTSYVKMSVGVSVSAQAQASLIGIVGVHFKVTLSAEGTLELLITRFTPESGFHLEDLNLALDVGVGAEGGAYLLWGAGAASVYGNLDMGLTLGIVPKLEIREVYVTGEVGVTWSLLWGLKNGKYVIAEGDIYRWPEEAQALAIRFREARNDPDSYETNDRAYLENRTQWQPGGDYLQKSIYSGVAPEIVTCGDTTLMVWLDDNAQRADSDFQTLYYSNYTENGWSEPVAVDDNGTFDCEFDVCAYGGKIYVIYTEMSKQSRAATPDISDQNSMDAFVSGVEVKVAVYENGSFGTPVQLTTNDICELLPKIDFAGGKLTATWLESNAVGLQAEASASSLRTATLTENGWSRIETVAQGQNTVSDLTAVSLQGVAYTAYIVDTDGDSQTQEDQALILRGEDTVPVQLDTGMISQVDSATIGEASVLTWCKDGKLYMISGAEQTPVCLTPESIAASQFRILPLSAQQSLLLFVAGNYDTAGNAVDGTDLYSVYIDQTGCQSDAVRLTRTEGYVSNYCTAYRGDKLVAVFTETFATVEGDDVQTVTHLRSTALDFYTDLILDSVDYDVTGAQPNTELPITLQLRNGGTNAIDGITAALYDSTGALVYTAQQAVSLPSGAAAECTVTVILPRSISAESYRMELLPQQGTMLAADAHPDDNRADLALAYADLQVDAEQKIIGEKNHIILTVSNSGNAGSQAMLQIYAPNKTGRLLSELETGVIAPGAAQQYMVDMGALVTDADSIVTCIAEAAFMDPFTLNNTDTVTLLHVQEDTFVTDPEQIIRNPELSVSTAEFDKFAPADISLQITAEAESFTAIEGLTENTDYTVDNKGVLTVRGSYLTALPTGSHALKLLFDFGYGEPVIRVLTVTVGDSTPVALTGSIAISGNPVVGSTVSADLSNLTPSGANLAYCWTVEDVPVSRERTYTIQKEDNGKTLALTVTGDAGYTGSFRVETAVALRQPAAPSAPVVSQIGSDFFTVAKAAGLEYSLDGAQWQENNRFEGLLPNQTYTVYARVVATDENISGQPSIGTPVTTKKMTVAAPAAPALAARTHTQITLVADPAMEYMLEGGAWTTDPVFSGLQPETDYVFYQRYKETETAYASPESKVILGTAPHSAIFGSVTGYGSVREPATVSLMQNGVQIFRVVATDGSYRFAGLVGGTYTLVVTQIGHLALELSVTLETEDLQQDIRLTPADYTVRFVNEDGTELSSRIYHWGDPVTPPADPTKAADDIGSYAFAGWDKEIVNCAGNATYTATYVLDRLYAVTVTADAQVFRYFTLTEAVAAAPAGSEIRLLQDTDIAAAFSQNISVDLNGFDITGEIAVAPGVTVSFKDSQTDDYTVEDEAGYGKLTGTVTGVQAAEGYMLITEEAGVSFHRIDLDIHTMTLRPSEVGVYYKSNFAGDEIVARNVARYGVALSVQGEPTENAPGILSWFEDFQAGSNAANGTLLHGIMKLTNSIADNAANAQLPVYGRAYLLTNDGRYIFGKTVSRSLRQQVEAIDSRWDDLTAQQQTGVLEMYELYRSVMENWTIPNIKSNCAK